MKNSKISWTDHTFNPWIGCAKVSPGCAHCYAEARDIRWDQGNWGPTAPRPITSSSNWKEPVKWNREAGEEKRRARVFCASLSDVCEDREELLEPRARLMYLIENTPNLDWLLLTKRPENYMRLFGRRWGQDWPKNVWVGASAENQATLDERLPHLLKVPASIRFLSAEPLLEGITFRPSAHSIQDMLELSAPKEDGPPLGARPALLKGLDWVIVGGESGHGNRLFKPEWARAIRDACKETGAAFFMKQLGGDYHKNDNIFDFPPDLRIQEWPEVKL